MRDLPDTTSVGDRVRGRQGHREVRRGNHRILDAYDLTVSLRAAAALAGGSHHTIKRYVDARAVGDVALSMGAG